MNLEDFVVMGVVNRLSFNLAMIKKNFLSESEDFKLLYFRIREIFMYGGSNLEDEELVKLITYFKKTEFFKELGLNYLKKNDYKKALICSLNKYKSKKEFKKKIFENENADIKKLYINLFVNKLYGDLK